MFENCKTLQELTAERNRLASANVNLVDVNNEYNKRRTEIINNKGSYLKLEPITLEPIEVKQFCGFPLIGRASNYGSIEITEKGILY